MLDVILALLPALGASVYYFGPRTLALAVVCMGSCVLAEYGARKIMKRDRTIGDLSAAVTGLLLALNLPSTLPFWIAALGGIFAIVVVKQFFGGLGQNFANPAMAARIMLVVSFAAQMTAWTKPCTFFSADATATATPMRLLSESGRTPNMEALPSLFDLFIGKIGGSMGETCAVALLLGGIYLIARRVISPVIPLSFIGTVAVLSFFWSGPLGAVYGVLGGGLLLGAIFMATDYVTSPLHWSGRLIFGVGCGVLTCLMRFFGNMPEGVSFAILLMNLLTPLIDRVCLPKTFGKEKRNGKK
jgi:electron transport complex protein RnfD